MDLCLYDDRKTSHQQKYLQKQGLTINEFPPIANLQNLNSSNNLSPAPELLPALLSTHIAGFLTVVQSRLHELHPAWSFR